MINETQISLKKNGLPFEFGDLLNLNSNNLYRQAEKTITCIQNLVQEI